MIEIDSDKLRDFLERNPDFVSGFAERGNIGSLEEAAVEWFRYASAHGYTTAGRKEVEGGGQGKGEMMGLLWREWITELKDKLKPKPDGRCCVEFIEANGNGNIVWDKRSGAWLIDADVALRFCPFCGTKLPHAEEGAGGDGEMTEDRLLDLVRVALTEMKTDDERHAFISALNDEFCQFCGRDLAKTEIGQCYCMLDE